MVIYFSTKAILVLSITYLLGGFNHETPQNVEPKLQKIVFAHCVADSQAEYPIQPDAGWHPALSDELLPSSQSAQKWVP
ncbi:MAG: hypothetical protein [Microvirus sp.]|nr:MAG: hypothetical protein [Microvirus sp.]